jgi:hemerythrin-like domain-containing protein
MNAIRTLMNEHRTVESVLDSLCMFARTANDNGADERDTLARFVELLRAFDELHHMKEEDMLFDCMLQNGFPMEGGPLAVMLADHKTCREIVSTLAGLAEQSEAWTDENRRTLDTTATQYTLFLKSHIVKEDNILYPMSERFLPENAWTGLDGAFKEFETTWETNGKLADFRRRVDELRKAWPAEDGPTPSGGCGF